MKRFTQFIKEAKEWIMRCRCHACDDWVTVTANYDTLPKKPCPKCEQVGWLESE